MTDMLSPNMKGFGLQYYLFLTTGAEVCDRDSSESVFGQPSRSLGLEGLMRNRSAHSVIVVVGLLPLRLKFNLREKFRVLWQLSLVMATSYPSFSKWGTRFGLCGSRAAPRFDQLA